MERALSLCGPGRLRWHNDRPDAGPSGCVHGALEQGAVAASVFQQGVVLKVPALFDKVLRAGEGKILRKLAKTAELINSIEDDFVDLTDEELRALTDEYKQRYQDGETLDQLLPEAFATVREAAKRTIGQRHYDVQLMGRSEE